ncbi:MAG: hypothetical protein FRX49_06720 [Trebouxia sp. A1-2]|nr:MAG: hypothetical protein FRX49_06720 [Trebouxia sp. A1-2]
MNEHGRKSVFLLDERRHTSICVLQEGYAQRHKHQLTNYEVGRYTVHSMQYGHQRPPLLELVLQSQQSAISENFDNQALACNDRGTKISKGWPTTVACHTAPKSEWLMPQSTPDRAQQNGMGSGVGRSQL